MKVLVLTADLGGNIPPTLAVAEALHRRGADVQVAGVENVQTPLPQIPLRATRALGDPRAKRGARQGAAFMALMVGNRTSREVAALIEQSRPDVVVVDCMPAAMIRGALRGNARVVVLFHTFGAFWVHAFDRGSIGKLCAMFGMRPSSLWRRASTRLLLTDEDLDPGRGDTALADFTWTGSTERGAEPHERGERPRVLVALSSSQWPGMLAVYQRIVAALAGMDVDAIVTTAGAYLGGVVEGASNVEIHGWVPHEELLPTVDLVIGHGGHSTTMKVLAHGVPLLIVPINPTSDQSFIGETIHNAGLGLTVPKASSVDTIREAVRTLLNDAQICANAAATGSRLRAQPVGAEIAAELILRDAVLTT